MTRSAGFCGHEIWSLALRKECRLRLEKKTLLRRMFGNEKGKVTDGENYTMRSF